MAITKRDPNTVYLGGPKTLLNEEAASEAITPGMLVERFNNGGIIRFRKSTRTGLANNLVMLDSPMLNKDCDTACAANDLIEVCAAEPGTKLWMFVASGATIVAGQRLTDAGNGYLKAVGSDIPAFEALENVTATVTPDRIRVEGV